MRGLAAQPDLEARSAEEVLADAIERFHPRLALACSFQKEESVLLHMLMRLRPDARVFTIDTGVLFEETREPWSAEHCCSAQKVAALERALGDLGAWVTGLRREQSATRADAAKLEWDEPHGLWKFNPLADWSDRDVWRFISEHDLPYNPLHDRGYESIGCAPCTNPGSGREGRWAGQERTECGLHGEG